MSSHGDLDSEVGKEPMQRPRNGLLASTVPPRGGPEPHTGRGLKIALVVALLATVVTAGLAVEPWLPTTTTIHVQSEVSGHSAANWTLTQECPSVVTISDSNSFYTGSSLCTCVLENRGSTTQSVEGVTQTVSSTGVDGGWGGRPFGPVAVGANWTYTLYLGGPPGSHSITYVFLVS